MFTSVNSRRVLRWRRDRRTRPAVSALVCLLVGGCAVGPNFSRPAAPALERYTAQPGQTRLEADGAAQTIELGQPTDPAWWRLFGSPALDDLVTTGLKNSPTLASATAALRQSKDLARAGAGVFFPQANGSFAAAREHSTPLALGENAPGSTFSLYTLTGAVSYAVDLFGGERRSVEALNAQADYQRYAVGSAYLLLTGDIVDAAIARAGYADQAVALTDIVRLDAAQQDILTAQYKAGYGALSAVLSAEQQLADDRQSLASARQRRDASTTLLKTLIGRETGEDAPPLPALSDIAVPPDAPVSLPSQLVRQRPDILQAEAALHQASAQVGVATAALFPSISITGDYGATNTSLSRLSAPIGRFWSIGPSVDVPIFRGGTLWFGRRAAQAALVKAEADYRQTVLAALEQVSDQLKALDADAETSAANRSAVDAAALNDTLAAVNLRAGVIADYDAMTLEILADRARLGLIAAKSQRLQDVVALYLASGGGWTGHEAGSGPGVVSTK
jgi:NodT family efflux transporter outer membrane factor (OMF) lipoprotein